MTREIWLFILIFCVSLLKAKLTVNGFTVSNTFSMEVDISIEIIKSCFPDRKRGTVLVGNFHDFDNQLAMNLKPAVMLSNNSSDNFHLLYKLPIFVVSVKSNLSENIKHLKNSRWWNHEGFFIILNDFSITGKCKNALDVLYVVWKMDILRTVFICTDPEYGVKLYTFNPYYDWAPDQWKKVESVTQASGDPWTIFSHKYFPKSTYCADLDFDKTLNLNGYRGIAATFSDFYLPEGSLNLSRMIYETFNATMVHESTHDYIKLDANGLAHGRAGEMLSNSSLDISLNLQFVTYMKTIVPSNMINDGGLGIISQYRGKKSVLEQFWDLFGWLLTTLTLLVSTITVTAFKILLKNNTGRAIMEIIRFWLNGSFINNLTGNPLRIFLFGIFFYVILFQSIIRGSILGFQIHPKSLKQINSIEDLEKLKNYKIYGRDIYISPLEKELQARSVLINNPTDCPKYVLNDSQAACISVDPVLKEQAVVYKLHMSRELSVKRFATFLMRKDWPMTKRFNMIVRRIFEASLAPALFIQSPDTVDILVDERSSKKLTLEHLHYAFNILAIGLVSASLCFVCEFFWLCSRFFGRE